jgi:hypothetical protein
MKSEVGGVELPWRRGGAGVRQDRTTLAARWCRCRAPLAQGGHRSLGASSLGGVEVLEADEIELP